MWGLWRELFVSRLSEARAQHCETDFSALPGLFQICHAALFSIGWLVVVGLIFSYLLKILLFRSLVYRHIHPFFQIVVHKKQAFNQRYL